MATWRGIYKSISGSQKLLKLRECKGKTRALKADLLFILCIVHADDYGHFDACNGHLRLVTTAAVRLSADDIEEALQDLEEAKLIELYKVGGNRYGAIVNFDEHQPAESIRKRELRNTQEFPFPDSVRTVSAIDKSRVEESRVEESRVENGLGAEPKTPSAPAPSVPPELSDLELYAADKKLCKAWPSLYKALKQSCPAVDVLAEVRSAHTWEVANPSKRKTLRTRFLRTWIEKEQDRAAGYPGRQSKYARDASRDVDEALARIEEKKRESK